MEKIFVFGKPYSDGGYGCWKMFSAAAFQIIAIKERLECKIFLSFCCALVATSSSREMPKTDAKISRLSELGSARLLSYLLTACLLTPTCSASCSCDKPFLILWLFSFSPSSIESPPAIILPNCTIFSTNYPSTFSCILKFGMALVNYIMRPKEKAISLYKEVSPRPPHA